VAKAAGNQLLPVPTATALILDSTGREMWDQFELGFWHPVGPYTGLSTDEVLEWKGGEVERHGWTFWSFVYSSSADLWLDLLAKAQSPVFALALIAPAPGIQIATRALS
jgi:hypothetical protein